MPVFGSLGPPFPAVLAYAATSVLGQWPWLGTKACSTE